MRTRVLRESDLNTLTSTWRTKRGNNRHNAGSCRAPAAAGDQVQEHEHEHEHEPDKYGHDTFPLRSCLKHGNSVKDKDRNVTYSPSTNFDEGRQVPMSKSDLEIHRARQIATDEHEFNAMKSQIMAKSPIYPVTVTSSCGSSSDFYVPAGHSPSIISSLPLYPMRHLTTSTSTSTKSKGWAKSSKRHIEDLEARVYELEQDRRTLLQAYEHAMVQLQQEHDVRKRAEIKAENLGLNYRIAKAKLHSFDGQMELFASQMRYELEKVVTPLQVRNPDYIRVPGLDSDDSFDSVSSL